MSNESKANLALDKLHRGMAGYVPPDGSAWVALKELRDSVKQFIEELEDAQRKYDYVINNADAPFDWSK